MNIFFVGILIEKRGKVRFPKLGLIERCQKSQNQWNIAESFSVGSDKDSLIISTTNMWIAQANKEPSFGALHADMHDKGRTKLSERWYKNVSPTSVTKNKDKNILIMNTTSHTQLLQ